MKRALFSITICLSLFLSQLVSANQLPSSPTLKKASTEAKVRLSKTYGKLPLAFEANEGQTDEQVKFLSRGSGYSLFLTPTETVLSLSKDDQATAIRMGLVGANPKPKMAGEEKLLGKTNYLIGNDPKKWRTNVSNFKKVRYEEVYPGIDLVYYGNQRKLEYDFIVKPGVDPKAIRMQFTGVDSMSVEAGDLVMHTDSGDVTQQAPIIYQEIDGKRKKVQGNYMFLADNQVGFYLGDYDKNQPLVIDPVLEYSTYLGGNGVDQALGITVDSSGNAYVTGFASTNFPTLNPLPGSGAFNGGPRDAFVTKLNATGDALIYSTYLGGNGDDQGFRVVVDTLGNAYVGGFTDSTNFPTLNPLPTGGSNSGSFDGFVTKLNPTGNALIYSTYLGGNGFDRVGRIAVDSSGNAYVSGQASSSNFPTQNPLPTGGANSGGVDGFVAKLNATGNALIYSTYLGGNGNDRASGIAVDSDGNAYVSGFTRSSNFPTLNPLPGGGAFAGGLFDGFVAKLNATGNALIYSTYLGGNGDDFARGMAVDSSGNAHVTGFTTSTNFPTLNPLPGGGAFAGGSNDAFVVKLNATGNALIYSTYLGGNGLDTSLDIALDADGNTYVGGRTGSTNFPILNPLPSGGGAFNGGSFDAFVAKLNATGDALTYSTYLGGSDGDFERVFAIAVDASGNAYVAGLTNSTNFPTQNPLPGGGVNAGDFDVFVSKIAPDNLSFTLALVTDKGKAEIDKLNIDNDRAEVRGDFTLDPASDKIVIGTNGAGERFIDEDITASFIGMFAETIPAGSLVEDPLEADKFVYAPAVLVPGPIDTLEIVYMDGALVGEFKVRWDDIDLEPKESALDASDPNGTNVPVAFTLDIGNDLGDGDLGFEIKVNSPAKKKYRFKD